MCKIESLESRVFLHAGNFDDAFNSGSLLTLPLHKAGAAVSAMAVLPGGAIIAAGTEYANINGLNTATNVLIVKYDFEGRLDPSFGDNGIIEARPRGMQYADQIEPTP